MMVLWFYLKRSAQTEEQIKIQKELANSQAAEIIQDPMYQENTITECPGLKKTTMLTSFQLPAVCRGTKGHTGIHRSP